MAHEVTFKPTGKTALSRRGLERIADIDPRLTRSNYFDNKLLTAEDLNRDQLYVDGRLREVGHTLGYGVLRGLELSLDTLNGTILLKSGVAINYAGRVLELNRQLNLDLGDRAAIAKLNKGRNRRLNRGLYAVILRYAEVATDVTEAFPTNLSDNRGIQHDVISESVQVGLVNLALPLRQQHPLHLRADLMRELYDDNTAGGTIPEDAVALGILAISNNKPQWLDAELLRQPLRSSTSSSIGAADFQKDLYRRYQSLFTDIMHDRRASALNGDFAAQDYLSLIPPVGSLPKDSLSPITGRQRFFPENFNVSIAPVRQSDVALLREESLVLPPIDLTQKEPIDIMVLVPLSNASYGHYAQRLERPFTIKNRLLGSLHPLRLRLYPRQRVHELDTDEATWQAIWSSANEYDVLYIRRPLRAAETSLSSIVLAQGVRLPDALPVGTLPTPADDNLLQDEEAVLLNRINIAHLSVLRPPLDAEGETAMESLVSEFSTDAVVFQQILDILLRVERVYDKSLWQTLLILARNRLLEAFHNGLILGQDDGEATGDVVANIGATFQLDAHLRNEWSSTVV